MSTELVVTFIALAGVIFSAIIAYVTSVRQSRIESARLQRKIYNGFSERIFEKRLELYPQLFEILSKFQKRHIDSNQISQQAFQDFLFQLYDLDSKISILFSKETGVVTHKFRKMIDELALKSDAELSDIYNSYSKRRELRYKFNEYELALKGELGIYAFDNPVRIGEFTSYQKYNEIVRELADETIDDA